MRWALVVLVLLLVGCSDQEWDLLTDPGGSLAIVCTEEVTVADLRRAVLDWRGGCLGYEERERWPSVVWQFPDAQAWMISFPESEEAPLPDGLAHVLVLAVLVDGEVDDELTSELADRIVANVPGAARGEEWR